MLHQWTDEKKLFEKLILAGVDISVHPTCIHPQSTTTAKPGGQLYYCREFVKASWHDSDIHAAVYNNDFEFFQYFDVPLNVNCRGKNAWTPLHIACKFNRVLITKALVMIFKADVFVTTNKGETPLMMAMIHGNLEIVNFLLRAMKLAELGIGFDDIEDDSAPIPTRSS